MFGCEFFLSYGMTETCGKICMSILPQDLAGITVEEQFALVVSSGRPFSLVDIKLVDADGAELAPGSEQVCCRSLRDGVEPVGCARVGFGSDGDLHRCSFAFARAFVGFCGGKSTTFAARAG